MPLLAAVEDSVKRRAYARAWGLFGKPASDASSFKIPDPHKESAVLNCLTLETSQ